MDEQAAISDSPTGWVSSHIREYVESDGERGHEYMGWPTLLLTTRGRKTGRLRRTALIYGQTGDGYVVVGSNAAAKRHPHWYLNLVADPRVDVQVRADKFTARARTAEPAEKPALWALMTSIFPTYDDYQEKAGREVPVVILERR